MRAGCGSCTCAGLLEAGGRGETISAGSQLPLGVLQTATGSAAALSLAAATRAGSNQYRTAHPPDHNPDHAAHRSTHNGDLPADVQVHQRAGAAAVGDDLRWVDDGARRWVGVMNKRGREAEGQHRRLRQPPATAAPEVSQAARRQSNAKPNMQLTNNRPPP